MAALLSVHTYETAAVFRGLRIPGRGNRFAKGLEVEVNVHLIPQDVLVIFALLPKSHYIFVVRFRESNSSIIKPYERMRCREPSPQPLLLLLLLLQSEWSISK